MTIITTPIYYVNGSPHIGHAYTSVIADVYKRYCNYLDIPTFLSTGTDEHGQKILDTSKKLGISVEDFVISNRKQFILLNDALNISNDVFIKTTDNDHIKNVKNIWNILKDKGDIYPGFYEGWYSIREETFFKESELIKKDDGFYTQFGEKVVWIKEKNHFFKLSRYSNKIISFFQNNPECIKPVERYNEILSFLSSGLEDVSVSRSRTYGIDIEENETVYVWFDALLNYLTVSERLDTLPEFIHFIGKDILKFHSVLWIAILFALNIEPVLNIYANGWWTANGKKISKSEGNVINPFDLVERFSSDVVRFFFVKLTFGKDADYRDDLIIVDNNWLANNYGNLIQRTFALILKRFNNGYISKKELDDSDLVFRNKYSSLKDTISQLFPDIHAILQLIINLIQECNSYINDKKPWSLSLEESEVIFFVLLENIYYINQALYPIIPATSQKINTFFKKNDNGFIVLKTEHVFERIK